MNIARKITSHVLDLSQSVDVFVEDLRISSKSGRSEEAENPEKAWTRFATVPRLTSI